MAATTLTDDDLRALVEDGLTQEDADLLTDEEAARLESLLGPPDQQPKATATPQPAASPAAPTAPGPRVPPKHGLPDPLRDQATLLLGEPNQKAPTTFMSAPTNFGPGRTVAQYMPRIREPQGLVQRLVSAFAGDAEPVEDVPVWTDRSMSGSATMESQESARARVMAPKEARLRSGQPFNVVGPGATVSPQTATAVGAVTREAILGQIESYARTFYDPKNYFTDHPIMGAINVAPMIAGWAKGLQSAKAAAGEAAASKILAKLDSSIAKNPKAAMEAVSALDQEIDNLAYLDDMAAQSDDLDLRERIKQVKIQAEAAQREVQKRIPEERRTAAGAEGREAFKAQVAEMEDALRANDPNMTAEQYRAAQKDINEVVRKRLREGVPDSPFTQEADDLTREAEKLQGEIAAGRAGGERPPVPGLPETAVDSPVANAETSIYKGTVEADRALRDTLSSTAPGVALLAAEPEQTGPDEEKPPGLFSTPRVIGAAVLTFGLARYLQSAGVRGALKNVLSLEKGVPADFERLAREVLLPFFPDRPITGLDTRVRDLATAGGAAAGVLVGGRAGQEEFSPGGAALGGLLGLGIGRMAGNHAMGAFKTGVNPRKLYDKFFTEAGGLTPEAFEAKQVANVRFQARHREIMDTARALDKLGPSAGALIQRFAAGELAPGQLPKKMRDLAFKTRFLFDELTLDLINSGLIQDELVKSVMVKNLGTYVPRLYLRHELRDEGLEAFHQWAMQNGGIGRVSSKDWLKHREDIPDKVREALGEIKDNPAYLLGKRGVITAMDVEMSRYHRFLLSSPEHAIPDAVVPTLTNIYKGHGIPEIADWQGRTYWKMPASPRWGNLSGKFIEAETADDLMSMNATAEGLGELIQKVGLRFFKEGKTVYNPASRIRDMISQTILADVVGGVGAWDIGTHGRAFKAVASRNKMYERGRKAGLFGGEWFGSEVGKFLEPGLKHDNILYATSEALGRAADKGADFFRRWSQFGEQQARMAVFEKALTKGMDDLAAARFARKAIPDYDNVPRWIKAYRSHLFGAPFISFSYKAIPRTMEAAFAIGDPKKFMRFWKYPMAMAAVNEYSAQTHGVLGKGEETDLFGTLRRMAVRTLGFGLADPDSYNTSRKYLPEYLGKQQLMVPWKDQFGREMYTDATYLFPWGDVAEVGQGPIGQALRNTGLDFLPRQLEPSNPWLQTAVAFMSKGYDSFQGKNIIGPGGTPPESQAQLGEYLMRTWGPSLLNPAGYENRNLRRSVAADPNDPYTAPLKVAIPSALGIRTRTSVPALALRNKRFELEKNMDTARAELRRAMTAAPAEFKEGEKVEQFAERRPKHPISRAYKKVIKLRDDFVRKYPEEAPPLPEKLVKAIEARRSK